MINEYGGASRLLRNLTICIEFIYKILQLSNTYYSAHTPGGALVEPTYGKDIQKAVLSVVLHV